MNNNIIFKIEGGEGLSPLVKYVKADQDGQCIYVDEEKGLEIPFITCDRYTGDKKLKAYTEHGLCLINTDEPPNHQYSILDIIECVDGNLICKNTDEKYMLLTNDFKIISYDVETLSLYNDRGHRSEAYDHMQKEKLVFRVKSEDQLKTYNILGEILPEIEDVHIAWGDDTFYAMKKISDDEFLYTYRLPGLYYGDIDLEDMDFRNKVRIIKHLKWGYHIVQISSGKMDINEWSEDNTSYHVMDINKMKIISNLEGWDDFLEDKNSRIEVLMSEEEQNSSDLNDIFKKILKYTVDDNGIFKNISIGGKAIDEEKFKLEPESQVLVSNFEIGFLKNRYNLMFPRKIIDYEVAGNMINVTLSSGESITTFHPNLDEIKKYREQLYCNNIIPVLSTGNINNTGGWLSVSRSLV